LITLIILGEECKLWSSPCTAQNSVGLLDWGADRLLFCSCEPEFCYVNARNLRLFTSAAHILFAASKQRCKVILRMITSRDGWPVLILASHLLSYHN
jgi:hypothetical protein